MKRCETCGVEKALTEFYKDSARHDGHRSSCKDCELTRRHEWHKANRERAIATAKAWQARNPERYGEIQERYNLRRRSEYRADHLMRTFGLTLDAYDAMLADQDGRCAICGDLPPEGQFLHVDHDHETGVIRGLLCVRCNNGLGLLRDSRELLTQGIDYLGGSQDPLRTQRLFRGMAIARTRLLVGASG